MTRFTIELSTDSPGFVTGKIIDEQSGDGIIFSVTVASDSTRASQKRVTRMLADHLNWFDDLSRGGTR